jgi:hypothetical protein
MPSMNNVRIPNLKFAKPNMNQAVAGIQNQLLTPITFVSKDM